MIKEINIVQYRKLKDVNLEFDKGVNIISGANGTCKSSLLHIISNSFQVVNKTADWVKDRNCIEIIKSINASINPKIESLTKGDKEYNDPAKGCTGTLFSITYFDGDKLDFRRHNTKSLAGKNRFSVKPSYKKGAKDSLPNIPIIYLGLSRLFPYGEYQNDESIAYISKKLPENYLNEISNLYKSFTWIDIEYKKQQKMGDIKTRADFSSQQEGVDSNTISAGEDNLFIIITALISLKYYYESIESNKEVESMLLIDEFDATLHPSFQLKLLKLFKEYSEKYKIQIVFTTHSLFLLEEALKKKYNVMYLIDHITYARQMPDVDIYKIKMHLQNVTREDIYTNRCIPIFTEDDEARLFLNCIFDYFEKRYNGDFSSVRGLFHLVNANISADALCNIFEDSSLLRATIGSICILDGDKNGKAEYSNSTIILPGGKSPEDLIFEYAEDLFNNDEEFWIDDIVSGKGYSKTYYRSNIKVDIDEIGKKISESKEKSGTAKGVKREENKKVFRKSREFFEFVIKKWIFDEENKKEMDKFYKDLKIMFQKMSAFNDISSKEWNS